MEEVYSKLEVMLAKSGFLANRLVTYVTYDYQMFVKDTLMERNGESDLLYKEIAANLFISPETVRKHVYHIYEKLHVNNRVEAVNKYFRR